GIRDDLVTGVQTCALPISEFERASGEARSQLIEQSRGVVEEIQRQFERAFSAEGGSLGRVFGEFETGLAEQIAAHFGADRSTARSEERRVGQERRRSRRRT